jgi:hypothetical protein
MTPADRLQAIIDRLLARLKDDDREAPGFIFSDDNGKIDDGEYDGIRDRRPEWTREDTTGWVDLGPLGKP